MAGFDLVGVRRDQSEKKCGMVDVWTGDGAGANLKAEALWILG